MQRERETVDFCDALGASRQALVTVAHDLKAPLSLIKLYAEQMRSMNISAEDREKYSRRIALSAEQLLKMTNGLLEAYRFGEQQLPLEPVNANIICEEVLHELTPFARELGQTLRHHITSRQHVVVAHRQLLRNVLFNVAHNALKHTPEKTVVTLRLSKGQTHSRIHVIDTGHGFRKSELHRLGSAHTLQPMGLHAGSGFGLVIAKQLTKAMGGELKLLTGHRGGHCLVLLHRSNQLALPL